MLERLAVRTGRRGSGVLLRSVALTGARHSPTASTERQTPMQIDIGASLQCNNTHMDEPTTAEKSEKSRGARQEGIPVGIVTGGPVEYASLNCDTVIYDIQKAEQEIYETLRVDPA